MNSRGMFSVALVTVAAVLGGCGGDDDEATTTAAGDTGTEPAGTDATEAAGADTTAAADGEAVTIDFLQPLPKSMAFYPLFVSEQLGYFAEEGVAVNLLPSGDIPATVIVPAGEADIGATTPVNIVAAAAAGEDVQLIYEYYQRNVFSIIVLADSDIQEPADLVGRNIGITSEGAGDASITRAVLADAGISESDVTLTVVGDGGPIVAEAMRSGELDAFAGAINDIAAMNVAGIESRSILPEKFDAFPASSMIMTAGAIEEMADPIGGFLRAWAKGTHAGLFNPDMIWAMAQDEVPEEVGDEEFGRYFLQQAMDLQTPVEGEDNYGALRPDAWEFVQEQMISGGELEEAIDVTTFLNDTFLEQANDWDRAEVEAEVEQWVAENL